MAAGCKRGNKSKSFTVRPCRTKKGLFAANTTTKAKTTTRRKKTKRGSLKVPAICKRGSVKFSKGRCRCINKKTGSGRIVKTSVCKRRRKR